MKKNLGPLMLVISGLVILLGLYLIYKTFAIFGIWTILWTGVVSTFSGLILNLFYGARSEKDGEVVFNPSEWPKFIQILISLGIGYYLFTILSNPEINNYDYWFGMSYLILLTAVPIVRSFIVLLRDRNDFVSISATQLKYRDNSTRMEFEKSNIKYAKSTITGITLVMTDDSEHQIPLSNMNFKVSDKANLLKELAKDFPSGPAESENTDEVSGEVADA